MARLTGAPSGDAPAPSDPPVDLAVLVPPSARLILVLDGDPRAASGVAKRLTQGQVITAALTRPGDLRARIQAARREATVGGRSSPVAFDAVVLDGVLARFSDPRPLLRTLRDVLHPDGVLVGVAQAARNLARLRRALDAPPGRSDVAARHRHDRDELAGALAGSGYTVTWLQPMRDPAAPWVPLPLDGQRADLTFGRVILWQLTADELEDVTARDVVFAAMPAKTTEPECSVVVVAGDRASARRAVETIARERPAGRHEAIVVGVGGDWSAARGSIAGARVERLPRGSLAAARNLGARLARGRFLAFIEDTAHPRPGWIGALLSPLIWRPDVGVTGSKQLRPDGTVAHAGMAIGGRDLPFQKLPYPVHQGAPGDAPHVNRARVMSAVAGGGLAMSRPLFVRAGGFDEAYRQPGYADADLCLRVRARGGRVLYCPDSVVDVGNGADDPPDVEDIARFVTTWLDRLGSDDAPIRRIDGVGLRDAYGAARGARARGEPLPVMWTGDFLSGAGYAEEARSFVLALDRAGRSVQANPVRWERMAVQLPPAMTARLGELMRLEPLAGGVHVVHSPPRTTPPLAGLVVPSEDDRFVRHPHAARHVGRTMWESDRIPPWWVAACNEMDEVWVPSSFNVETFARSGVARSGLHVVPGALPVDPVDPDLPPLPLPGLAGFVFLSVFEWTWRKGWDVLVRAFAEEFHRDEAVTLLLHVQPAAGRSAADHRGEIARLLWEALRLKPDDHPPIVVRAGRLPTTDLLRLYRAADVFVLPTRGEGFGRPFMEAMAMGLPAIGTRWSGHLDFMRDDTAYLVDCVLTSVPERMWREGEPYRGQRCAEPSTAHLRQLMRRVLSERGGEAAARAARGQREVLERFSWPAVAAAISERLDGGTRTQRSPVDAACRVAIQWRGPQFGEASVAVVNRELCRALAEDGDLEVRAVVGDRAWLPAGHAVAAPSARRPIAVTISHERPPSLEPPAEGRWVLMQSPEAGSVPRDWIAPIDRLVDEIWVPSHHARTACIRSGIDPRRVTVIPQGVNPDRFHPAAAPRRLATRKTTRLLFVGGSAWLDGLDLALEAYLGTFGPTEDVCLVIKNAPAGADHRARALHERVRSLASDLRYPEILRVDDDLSDEGLASLYTACHALVHPARSMRLGLTLLEAMACGVPVIATGHGMALEVTDSETSYVLPAREVTLPEPRLLGVELADRPVVAEVDTWALATAMRRVVEHPEEARGRGRRASERVRRDFSWQESARGVRARVLAISGQEPRRRTAATPTRRPRLTVCMVVRDEEARLARCLASVREVADEIVVVDTGSTDHSVEVARNHGARVFDEPWRDDWAAARNAALDRATGDWALAINADQTLDPGSQAEVRRLIDHDARHGYLLRQLDYRDEMGDASVVERQVTRLFPVHPAIRYRGRIREQVISLDPEMALRLEPCGVVLHDDGNRAAEARRRKAERAAAILERVIAESPDDAWRTFHLGAAYAALGRHGDAERTLRRAIAAGADGADRLYLLSARAMLAAMLIQQDRAAEASVVCEEAIALAPSFAEAWGTLGAAELRLGHAETARVAFERALASHAFGGFPIVDRAASGWRAWLGLGQAERMAGRHVDATRCFERALALNPVGTEVARTLDAFLADPALPERDPVRHRLQARRFAERGDLDGALRELRSALALDATDPDTLGATARVLRQFGADTEADQTERAERRFRVRMSFDE